MTKHEIFVAVALMLAVGCASGPQKSGSLTAAPTQDVAPIANSAPAIAQVDYKEPATQELIQPPGVVEMLGDEAESVAPQRLPSTDGLTMEALEQMALANSPAIAQSAARVRALRGKWVQVGLPPNPTAGYVASEIGNEGAAGQQGGFIGQNFITAKKLQRNRAVVAAEIDRGTEALQEDASLGGATAKVGFVVAARPGCGPLADKAEEEVREAVGQAQLLAGSVGHRWARSEAVVERGIRALLLVPA